MEVREGGREERLASVLLPSFPRNVSAFISHFVLSLPPSFPLPLAQYFNGYMRGPFASFCARREWEHEREAEGGMGGGVEGLLPPLFAHGHRRLAMPLSGGSRQHHLQQVHMLTVCGKGGEGRREGGKEGGREGGRVRC